MVVVVLDVVVLLVVVVIIRLSMAVSVGGYWFVWVSWGWYVVGAFGVFVSLLVLVVVGVVMVLFCWCGHRCFS